MIGDLIASREDPKRKALHRKVLGTLGETNEEVPATQPLQPTIGDEFQGVYDDLGSAIRATLLVRLRLKDVVDVRFGVGWGKFESLSEGRSPFEQDGPAWWAAREALEVATEVQSERGSPKGMRTVCRIVSGRENPSQLRLLPANSVPVDSRQPAATFINSFLICRDEIVSSMSSRDTRILLAVLSGQRQEDIAKKEGITQSAVSQRLLNSGSYAVVETQRALEGTTRWNRLASG